jgi:uncharacterized membrane protein
VVQQFRAVVDNDEDVTRSTHDHDHSPLTATHGVRRLLRILIAVVAVATVVGVIVWWPSGGAGLSTGIEGQGDRVNATVTGDTPIDCAGPDLGVDIQCDEIQIDITSGPNAGTTGSFQIFPEAQAAAPEFSAGDRIVVIEFILGDTGDTAYSFADYQRSRPLIVLALLFVAAVIALGRFQGVRALAGLVVSAMVLFGYIFPALLDGQPPLPVALTAASVIAFAALYLAHGVNDTTSVALLGTLAALALTGILGAVFTAAAQITGVASEDQIFLLVSAEGIDLRGLVLAGIIIGSLGVLDDVTVTQVSAVARLHEANPDYTVRDLYRTGVHIGRDHIASTVNTLVLAYAGAALPLLLFYSNVGIGITESITSEIIAVEIIRTLVGSIGLVSAVPLTTLLAALVVTGSGIPAPTRPRQPAVAASPEPDDPGTPDWTDFEPEGRDF